MRAVDPEERLGDARWLLAKKLKERTGDLKAKAVALRKELSALESDCSVAGIDSPSICDDLATTLSVS